MFTKNPYQSKELAEERKESRFSKDARKG